MEHNDDNVEKTTHDSTSSNEDLYARDLPISLSNRLSSPSGDNHMGNTATTCPTVADTESDMQIDSHTRTNSPPFQQPASWEAIDRAHTERIANEKAFGIGMAKKHEIRRLELSLVYRGAQIHDAMSKWANNEQGGIVPKPWGMAGLRGDLTRHPNIFEMYLYQETSILSMIKQRIAYITDWSPMMESPRAKIELRYLKKQMKLRQPALVMAENKALLGDMLAIMLDNLILDVENNVDKSSQTAAVSDIPSCLLNLINEDESLQSLLETLRQVERAHYPHLFQNRTLPFQLPELQLEHLNTPLFENPVSQLPRRPYRHPSWFKDIIENDPKISTENKKLHKRKKSVRIELSSIEKYMSNALTADESLLSGLKKRLHDSQDISLRISPERSPPPVVHMNRPISGPHDQESSKGTQNQTSTSRTWQQGTDPEQSSLIVSDTEKSFPSLFQSGLQSAPKSPETAPSTSPSRSVQPSSAGASISAVGSPPLTPLPSKTPTHSLLSPALNNIAQAAPVPASRLKYRLEVEKRRSFHGVVQQVRFSEPELFPGEFEKFS